MDEITKYVIQLPYVSCEDFARAQENLSKNMKQKTFFREKQYYVYKDATISEDFTGENHRRSYYKNCKFINANLTNVGLSGSIINSTDFCNSIMVNTKMDSCELDRCIFLHEKHGNFTNVNLSKSIISNSSFVECEMEATNFTDTTFENVDFTNCVWRSLSLENSVFSNTTFDSVNLNKLNFEFSQFHNVHMNDVRLPFPTIPYIINGLTYLISTSDNIWVSSAQSPTGKISAAEYLAYLEDLEIFYNKTQNYFPLANIYISKKLWDKAFSAILLGIKFSVEIRNFRLVNYYCKLLQLTQAFSGHMLSYAYNYMIKNTDAANWRPQDRYNYSHYIDSIRNTLMNERDSSSLQFSINTNISCNEHGKLATLIEVIDDVARLAKKYSGSEVKHYIEIRHSSPFELFIKFFGISGTLLFVLGISYYALWGSNYLADKIQEHKNKYWDNKTKKLQYKSEEARSPYYGEMARLEIEEKKQALYEKAIDIELKEIELKKRKEEELNEAIRDNGIGMHKRLNEQKIIIINGGHTFFESSHEVYDGEIIHHYRE